MSDAAVAFEMFRCDRRQMTLSKPGCARLWESAQANRPQEYEGRFACLTCPVGAAHDGKAISTAAASVEALRRVCPRCRRQAAKLINERHCISCYNRHREALVGRNAKGGRPLLCDKLHVARLAVIDNTAPRIVQQDRVVDLVEVIVAYARAATGAMAFGRGGVIG